MGTCSYKIEDKIDSIYNAVLNNSFYYIAMVCIIKKTYTVNYIVAVVNYDGDGCCWYYCFYFCHCCCHSNPFVVDVVVIIIIFVVVVAVVVVIIVIPDVFVLYCIGIVVFLASFFL